MAIKVYQYPKCGTCRKALAWLESRGIPHTKVDITEKPPSKSMLRKAMKLGGYTLQKLFNTSGQAYRQGGFKDKLGSMSEGEALDALASNGKLIKRPMVISGDTALVGFREAEWEERLGS